MAGSGQAFTVYVIHAMVVTAAGHALSSLDVPTVVKFGFPAYAGCSDQAKRLATCSARSTRSRS